MMKISVIIPLYNKKDKVLRALGSVLNQTALPDEIIIVNDGSTDGSDLELSGINDPLVKIIRQTNSGVSAARNTGIREAKGEWIAFLDADDEWIPEFLETIISLSEKYPDCQVLATAYFNQDSRGLRNRIILKRLPFPEDEGLLSNYFEVASCSHPPLWSSAVTVKKSALNNIGGFPGGITSGEDLLTWARLAVNYPIAYSLIPLSVFIQCEGHTYNDKPTRVPQAPDVVGEELARLARQFRNVPGLKNYVGHWHKMRGSMFLRLGRKKEALSEVMKSLSFKALNFSLYAYVFFLLLPLPLVNRIFKMRGKA